MIQSRCFSIFPRFPTISYLYLDGTCIALAWDPQLVTVFTKKIQTRKPVEPISCACMACCSDRWRGKLGNHGFQHSNRFKYKLLTTHAFENTALKCGVLVSSEIDPCFFVHRTKEPRQLGWTRRLLLVGREVLHGHVEPVQFFGGPEQCRNAPSNDWYTWGPKSERKSENSSPLQAHSSSSAGLEKDHQEGHATLHRHIERPPEKRPQPSSEAWDPTYGNWNTPERSLKVFLGM